MDERAHKNRGEIQLSPSKRHSFRPLLFAPPQGADALPKTLPPPAPRSSSAELLSLSLREDAPLHSLRSENDALRLDGVRESIPSESRGRGQHDSHVRLRAADLAPPALRGHVELLEAQDLLDELCDDQLTLSMNLACLERATQDRPRDPSTIAALLSLEARVRDLGNVRDALAVLQLSTISRGVHRAFLPDSPLADYVRGVYAWMHALLRALDQLVAGIVAMQPDWATYRWRIEEANNFHFDDLEAAIRGDLLVLFEESGDEASVAQLGEAFDVLLVHARALETRLEERFG